VEELVVPEKRHVIGTAWSDEAIKNEVAIRRIVLFMIGHPLWFTIQVTRRRTQRGKDPPPDSNPFNDAEFSQNSVNLSSQFAARTNRRFQFQKLRPTPQTRE